MATRASRTSLAWFVVIAALFLVTATAGAAPTWRAEPLPKPADAPFTQPLGIPADISCLTATRCLLIAQGGAYYKNGFFFYDGASWRRQGTVCGMGVDASTAETTRVVWAGPAEFWTITEPSAPRTGLGQALCHIVNGEVVGSYSTAQNSPDRFATMTAGACAAADDCWFGGVGAESPDGSRIGGFRIHWDGSQLRTVYAPQGRGVSDMVVADGEVLESKFVGPGPRQARTPDLEEAELEPRLIHSIEASVGPGGDPVFTPQPFAVDSPAGFGAETVELTSLDTSGGSAWAAGGGATSGPGAGSQPAPRGPLIARRAPDGLWSEIDITASGFAGTDVFRDVSVLPDGNAAWVVVQDQSLPATNSGVARVARIEADGSVSQHLLLAAGGLPAGTAQRIECPAAEECWAVTHRGLVFHLTDGAPRAAEVDPAFAQMIAYRPNESLEQGLGDGGVVDDSLLFAPPEVIDEEPVGTAPAKRLKPAVRSLRSKLKGNRLTISFVVIRKARIGFTLRRKGRTVARVKSRMIPAGKRRRSLSVRLSVKRWPDNVRFSIREPGQTDVDDDDTVSVPDSGVIG